MRCLGSERPAAPRLYVVGSEAFPYALARALPRLALMETPGPLLLEEKGIAAGFYSIFSSVLVFFIIG